MTLTLTEKMVVVLLTKAIAFAEGFYVTGSRPQRNNNPGDLKHAPDTYHTDIHDGDGLIIFHTEQDGWDALRHQCKIMMADESVVYHRYMTIGEVASKWAPETDEAQHWAANVAGFLGVSTTCPLYALSDALERLCER